VHYGPDDETGSQEREAPEIGLQAGPIGPEGEEQKRDCDHGTGAD
jgi:hypothetical protein